jgi:hypothetical protein
MTHGPTGAGRDNPGPVASAATILLCQGLFRTPFFEVID